MAVVEVRDRDEIAAFCRRRPAVHAYALGDLDDFFWPHTRWFAWAPDGVIEQLVLLYDEPDPLVVHALAEPPSESMSALALGDRRPPSLAGLRTCDPDVPCCHDERAADARASDPAPEDGSRAGRDRGHRARRMRRCSVPSTSPRWRPSIAPRTRGRGSTPRMLETRRYVGIRQAGALVSIAGVHVYSPRLRRRRARQCGNAPVGARPGPRHSRLRPPVPTPSRATGSRRSPSTCGPTTWPRSASTSASGSSRSPSTSR